MKREIDILVDLLGVPRKWGSQRGVKRLLWEARKRGLLNAHVEKQIAATWVPKVRRPSVKDRKIERMMQLAEKAGPQRATASSLEMVG